VHLERGVLRRVERDLELVARGEPLDVQPVGRAVCGAGPLDRGEHRGRAAAVDRGVRAALLEPRVQVGQAGLVLGQQGEPVARRGAQLVDERHGRAGAAAVDDTEVGTAGSRLAHHG